MPLLRHNAIAIEHSHQTALSEQAVVDLFILNIKLHPEQKADLGRDAWSVSSSTGDVKNDKIVLCRISGYVEICLLSVVSSTLVEYLPHSIRLFPITIATSLKL